MLEPRPEIKIATRFFMSAVVQRGSSRQIETSAKIHHRRPAAGDDFAQSDDGFAVAGKLLDSRFDEIPIEYDDHADAAVESAQHLLLADAACRGKPFEHGQHRHTSEVDADCGFSRQHARNVFNKAAAGDVSE